MILLLALACSLETAEPQPPQRFPVLQAEGPVWTGGVTRSTAPRWASLTAPLPESIEALDGRSYPSVQRIAAMACQDPSWRSQLIERVTRDADWFAAISLRCKSDAWCADWETAVEDHPDSEAWIGLVNCETPRFADAPAHLRLWRWQHRTSTPPPTSELAAATSETLKLGYDAAFDGLLMLAMDPSDEAGDALAALGADFESASTFLFDRPKHRAQWAKACADLESPQCRSVLTALDFDRRPLVIRTLIRRFPGHQAAIQSALADCVVAGAPRERALCAEALAAGSPGRLHALTSDVPTLPVHTWRQALDLEVAHQLDELGFPPGTKQISPALAKDQLEQRGVAVDVPIEYDARRMIEPLTEAAALAKLDATFEVVTATNGVQTLFGWSEDRRYHTLLNEEVPTRAFAMLDQMLVDSGGDLRVALTEDVEPSAVLGTMDQLEGLAERGLVIWWRPAAESPE